MSTGIKFHTDGAAERKAREPITVLIRETVRVPDSDDLKRRVRDLDLWLFESVRPWTGIFCLVELAWRSMVWYILV